MPRGHSRVETARNQLATLIVAYRETKDRNVLLIQIRIRQEALGTLRQRNLKLFSHTSDFAWVDAWDPDADEVIAPATKAEPRLDERVGRSTMAADLRRGRGSAESNDNRRWAPRTPCSIGVQLVQERFPAPIRCTMRDQSSTGALIDLGADLNGLGLAAKDVPSRLTLVIPSKRQLTEVECVVMWRGGNHVGVRFSGVFKARTSEHSMPMPRRKR